MFSTSAAQTPTSLNDDIATTAASHVRHGLSFGPFNLIVSERLLTNRGVSVDLGGRAFEILIALVSKPNEVVTKKELMSRAWPDVTVEESSLRFHMACLRKALGDGKDGARYITTLAGRGYCFVAPVSRVVHRDTVEGARAVSVPHGNVPSFLTDIVGRDDDALSPQLTATRLVVGAGGAGKTAIAIALGQHLATTLAGAVLLVDLGKMSDPDTLANALASVLGLDRTSVLQLDAAGARASGARVVGSTA